MPKLRDEESGGRIRDEPKEVRLRDKKHHGRSYSKEKSLSDSLKRPSVDFDQNQPSSVSELGKLKHELLFAVFALEEELDQEETPSRAAAKKALSFILAHGSEGLSQELQDEEMLSSVFDWATESLARTASMAQEAVEHRRELLREMAVRERQIDQKLARTARNLERLIAG